MNHFVKNEYCRENTITLPKSSQYWEKQAITPVNTHFSFIPSSTIGGGWGGQKERIKTGYKDVWATKKLWINVFFTRVSIIRHQRNETNISKQLFFILSRWYTWVLINYPQRMGKSFYKILRSKTWVLLNCYEFSNFCQLMMLSK